MDYLIADEVVACKFALTFGGWRFRGKPWGRNDFSFTPTT
jgi:hypothetical protein